jgi:hypothetical protein
VDGARWNEPKKVLGVCGGAMFLRAEALAAAGLLPDDFEIYLDDLDLCLRIWDAGYECWSCPAATVRHKFSATMGEGARARRKYYLNTRNRLRLMLRNFPSRQLPAACVHYAISEIRSIGRAALNGELWKAAAHVTAWLATAGYFSKALAQRESMKARGHALGSYWPFIRTDTYFFPGIELPMRGWYAPRSINGTKVHPVSGCATAEIAGGELSVTHANCYPTLGATKVELRLNGRTLATLSTAAGPCTEHFTVEAGTLEIISHRVFEAELTGETFDIGGWIAVSPPQPDGREK